MIAAMEANRPGDKFLSDCSKLFTFFPNLQFQSLQKNPLISLIIIFPIYLCLILKILLSERIN